MNDESEILIHKNRQKQKLLKVKKKHRVDLSHQELLQDTNVFRCFGFRTLQMTACLKCKNVSRKIDFHLNYDLAISHDFDSMSA